MKNKGPGGAVSNVIWRAMEKVGAQGVSFLVSVVLARLLDPSAYGSIALITVFISVLQVFVDGGFGTALIQKKNADNIDFSTVFYFNLALCLTLYAGVFLLAPWIATSFGDPTLAPVIRVQSLLIVIASLKNVQSAYVARNMMFRRFFFATLAGTVAAAVLGVSMALAGYGVWALVAQSLLNNAVDTIVLWWTVKWRPQRVFSLKRLKELFRFGWKMFASNLLDVAYANIRQLIVGLRFSTTDLAFYNKGESLTKLVITDAVSSVEDVAFPMTARLQEDHAALRAMTSRVLKIATFVCCPVLLGIAATADHLVDVVYTSKWAGAVPYLVIFCFSGLFYPLHVLSLNVIKSIGRSDIILKLEIVKKVLEILFILVAMQMDPLALAASALIFTLVTLPMDVIPNSRLIGYSFGQCLKDVAPNFLIAGVMAAAVYGLGRFGSGLWMLLLQVTVGVAIFVVLARLFQRESFDYLLGILKRKHKGE